MFCGGTEGRANYRAEREEEQGNAYQTGGAQVVSSLSQPMSNAEFVAALSQERNRGFNTAVGTAEVLSCLPPP